MPTLGELIATVVLVLTASGLCSGTEAALFSVPTLRARRLAEDGTKGGKVLLKLRENMGRPIAAIVVLNNIANIVGSIATGAMAAHVLGDRWVGLFSGVLTFLVIICSEILPKTLGERHAERIGLTLARPVRVLTIALTPLLWLIEQLTARIASPDESPTTDEAEIKLLARIGAQEGVLEETESRIVERAFRLNDQVAGDVMTPRVAITSLRGTDTLGEVKDAIITSEHSRIVVLGEQVDDVLGVVLKDDLLTALVEGATDATVQSLAREANYVPTRARCDALLRRFLSTHVHLSIVVDEFGGVAGVVTLEDVLETITGEIMDETDSVADLRKAARSAAARNSEMPRAPRSEAPRASRNSEAPRAARSDEPTKG